jgi:cyanate permease
MAMVSRNTLAKWFDRQRGLASGISGLFVAFSFSGAPLLMNSLINGFGYPGSMILMALICGFGMACLGWLFYRDQPEDCGMLMDGKTPTSGDTTLSSEREVSLAEALRSYNFWIFCLGMCSSSVMVTGFTFHISSIGNLAGLSRYDAYSVFLPMSIFSVISHFIAGWASDRMPLKYLLMLLVGCLGLGSIGLLAYEEIWSRWMVIICYGIQGGIWGCLSIVAWPRFYGRKHLGSINGVFMGAMVFASAIGPPLFGASENLSGSYNEAALISVLFNFLLLLGATKATSYYDPKTN